MSLNEKWVPIRWRCGPADGTDRSPSTREDGASLQEAWADPSALRLLAGTPFNCLVVNWATGTAGDAAQQQALRPLIAAGRKLGLSFVGKIAAKANGAESAAAGRAADLDAVMMDGAADPNLALPVISGFAHDAMDWQHATPIFSTGGNVWPGVNLPTMHGDTALGGPTGEPWVNSNGWFALLSHRMAAGKALWLEIDLPNSQSMLPADSYCLAVADSWAHGSRWIVDLDEPMRAGLVRKDADALQAWKGMSRTAAFFESHAEWKACRPVGNMGVVSDFSVQNAYLSGEVLHLLNRRRAQFVVLDRKDPLTLAGLKAVLWVDDAAPSADQHQHLLAFAEQGGVVIAGSYWGPAGVQSHREDWLLDFDIYPVGKGKIAVAAGGFSDPYQLARDAHLLMGRENDVARLYNPRTTSCFTGVAPGGRREVVQIVNYAAPRPAPYVTLWINSKAKAARLWIPEAEASNSLPGISVSQGTSFELPTLAVNYALEIERSA